ncbi:hypothetical protein BDZ89DRAFT_1141797 [Hymenopellis radicata]|nr:hypothetical protein BDZ89DRAFT_1141797 [Hymenopellis radicata]
MSLVRLDGKHHFACQVEGCNVRFFIPNVNDIPQLPLQINLQGSAGKPFIHEDKPESSTSARQSHRHEDTSESSASASSRRRNRSPSPIMEVIDLTEDDIPSPPRKRTRKALPTTPLALERHFLRLLHHHPQTCSRNVPIDHISFSFPFFMI